MNKRIHSENPLKYSLVATSERSYRLIILSASFASAVISCQYMRRRERGREEGERSRARGIQIALDVKTKGDHPASNSASSC